MGARFGRLLTIHPRFVVLAIRTFRVGVRAVAKCARRCRCVRRVHPPDFVGDEGTSSDRFDCLFAPGAVFVHHFRLGDVDTLARVVVGDQIFSAFRVCPHFIRSCRPVDVTCF